MTRHRAEPAVQHPALARLGDEALPAALAYVRHKLERASDTFIGWNRNVLATVTAQLAQPPKPWRAFADRP